MRPVTVLPEGRGGRPRNTGSLRRGHIGVSIKDFTLAVGAPSPEVGGALIAGVSGGSPAERGGIQKGDIVIAADGVHIRGAAGLRNKLGLTPVGERAQLTVKRNGVTQIVVVEVAPADDITRGSINQPNEIPALTLFLPGRNEDGRGRRWPAHAVAVSRVPKVLTASMPLDKLTPEGRMPTKKEAAHW